MGRDRLSGPVAKCAGLAGECGAPQARLDRLRADLAHLDAAIRIMDPARAPERVPPKKPGRKGCGWFGRGEPGRLALEVLREAQEPLAAVAAPATRAGEKLRAQGIVAGHLAAFVHTSPHREGPRRGAARATRLLPPTSDTRELVAAAARSLEAAWRGGFSYVKAGVLLDDLCAPEAVPPDLFATPLAKSAALMAAVDALNARYGRGTVVPAAVGVERAREQQAAHRSPRRTTRVDEVPTVGAWLPSDRHSIATGPRGQDEVARLGRPGCPPRRR